uniref:hypothetical protein n=1 Tax=Clavibacter michiganensis TaxID=28447 RepID=UPI002930A6FF
MRLVAVRCLHPAFWVATRTALASRLDLLAQLQIRFRDYVATAFEQCVQWRNGDAQQPVRDCLTGAQEELQQA